MSAILSLPPAYRDFQIYQRIVIEGASTRQAAGEFSLSQTRIRQIVQRVSHWLTDNLPSQDEATDAAYLRHAQHVAADRLSHFFSVAMDGWHSERQVKYFNMAIRVALAQSKLAVLPGTIECLLADAIERPLPEEVQSPKSQVQSPAPPLIPKRKSPTLDVGPGTLDLNPPTRDCSPAPKNNAPAQIPPAAPPIAKPMAPNTCADLPTEQTAARRAFLTPAHSAPPRADLPVTELRITPEQLGFQTPTRSASERRLSRRERRKLRRAKARA